MIPYLFAWGGCLLSLVAGLAACQPAAQALAHQNNTTMLPEPHREFLDTTLIPPTGQAIHVREGDSLQDAIDAAQLGDTILLEAGATFKGPFTLPNKKSGTGWITIRTSTPDRHFPSPGTRVGPSHASLMPRLISQSDGVVLAERGAHHYRFIGLEIKPQDGVYLNGLVVIGTGREPSRDDQPHHIIVDRSYLHGDPKKGTRRGVIMNGRYLAVIDSYAADFKDPKQDSQAIVGWSGAGPFKIVNNYLEGAAENVAFGGGDPLIQGLVPSDIEIRWNRLAKPLAWKRGAHEYDGSGWVIKNLFELKNARRVVIDGNVFEYNWADAQSGFAILFTVRNQDRRSPWSVIEDVSFTNNIVRHTGSGLNILGVDDIHPPSERTKRILVRNNLWEDVNSERWGGKGRLFQLGEGPSDIVIEHNTGDQNEAIIVAYAAAAERFVFRSNVAPHNAEGITATASGVGNSALLAFFPRAVVTNNVMVGGDDLNYPSGNFFPHSLDEWHASVRSRPDGKAPGAKHASEEQSAPGVQVGTLCAALGPNASQEPVCKGGMMAGGRP